MYSKDLCPVGLMYASNPSAEDIDAALQADGTDIQYLPDPTPRQKQIAVTQTGLALEFIEDQSDELHLLAQESNFLAVLYMKFPNFPTIRATIQANPAFLGRISHIDSDVLEACLRDTPCAIKGLAEPSEALQMIAIEEDPRLIGEIMFPCEQARLLAVSRDGMLLGKLKTFTKEVAHTAMANNPYAIQFLSKPTEDEQRDCIMRNPYSVQFIRDLSNANAALAVTIDAGSADYMVDDVAKSYVNKMLYPDTSLDHGFSQ